MAEGKGLGGKGGVPWSALLNFEENASTAGAASTCKLATGAHSKRVQMGKTPALDQMAYIVCSNGQKKQQAVEGHKHQHALVRLHHGVPRLPRILLCEMCA